MAITDLADKHIGVSGGNLARAGINCQKITDAVGNVSSSSSLIATMFWQAFMFSPAYYNALQRAGVTSRAINDGQTFILRHGVRRLPRHDLIVFDSGFTNPNPSVIQPVFASVSELRQGWNTFIDSSSFDRSRIGLAILRYGQEAVTEAIKIHEFGIMVLAPLPRQYTTSLLPSPALGVAHKIEPSICTIGVIAKDANGREGATTSLHSLDPNNTNVSIQGISGASKGITGVIKSQDKNIVTDSCFIEIPGILASHLPPSKYLSGPLRGMPPGTNGPVSFETENRGVVTTQVIGWSTDIPLSVAPWKQLEVWTDPVTVPSDSGTALIDSNSLVVGFAYHMTGTDSGYSAWIWAESVFDAHMLQ